MFQLTSPGIRGHVIAPQYGLHGDCEEGVPQLSIPLCWNDPPEGTVSFALVFQDYDNIPEEGFSWIHWRRIFLQIAAVFRKTPAAGTKA